MSVTFQTTIRDESANLNLANGNFATFMVGLGFDTTELDYCGTLEPIDLLERIERLRRHLASDSTEFERSWHDSHSDPAATAGARLIDAGCDKAQLERYCAALATAALRALKLGGQVQYG